LKKEYRFWVYIMANHNNRVLYIGMTNDIARRAFEHQNKLVKGFTSRYNVNKLVYFEEHQYADKAIEREFLLKTWQREWKMKLVEKSNPHWEDLTSTLMETVY
jgi:putative endonuclease